MIKYSALFASLLLTGTPKYQYYFKYGGNVGKRWKLPMQLDGKASAQPTLASILQAIRQIQEDVSLLALTKALECLKATILNEFDGAAGHHHL